MDARCELSACVVSSAALYGVRVSRIGARLAPLGMRISVCSLTPSRMGIITSRRTYSSESVLGTKCAGVSFGNVACAPSELPDDGLCAKDGMANHSASSSDSRQVLLTRCNGFMNFSPEICAVRMRADVRPINNGRDGGAGFLQRSRIRCGRPSLKNVDSRVYLRRGLAYQCWVTSSREART